MKYKVIILDLDNTLIDFNAMELGSLNAALTSAGVEVTEDLINDYISINTEMWEGLEKGRYEKSEILIGRFEKLAKKYSLDLDPVEVNSSYLNGMADFLHFMPHAKEILEWVKESESIVAMITNGVLSAQEAKINAGNLDQYFDEIVISDAVGYHKPQVEIFDHLMDLIGSHQKRDMIIVGDSLTSDIQGGINYGIDTCWFNPYGKKLDTDQHITYVIESLEELKEIL